MNTSIVAKRKLNMVKHKAYKHRADIAFVGGAALTMFGTFKFVKNTFKLAEKYAEHKEIKEVLSKDETDEGKQELAKLNRDTMKETVKAYAVPLTVSTVGYALQIWSHHEVKSELATANLALTSVTAAYEALKAKIIETEGEDKWMQLGHDVTVEGKKNDRSVVFGDNTGRYTLLYTQDNSEIDHVWMESKGCNKAHLISKQSYWDFRSEHAEDIILLREVLADLGVQHVADEMKRNGMNPNAGWPIGMRVDFGLYSEDEATKMFMAEQTPDVLLRFNCVENVYDYI